ncbi:TIGR04423 family type III CRISPR-associated protein [Campylobacter geochelonis]|uniref:TIGR04423 family type III CRISPR-associated protein n=1 Tax=Campylobacter geochelonis TaxID=1780362 RepID=A0A128E9Y1_9BACT|nr:TIGR04423 family type III CRISPR-associated protein [Campylobacter geochelonis]QKF72050.1 CRISPR/Cas system-associated protein, type III-D (TIGR03984 family) [Campylobacter geochelonis]CZE45800.1 Uncharacterised protein [Campylobacter geochelonis]CZE46833.1 Uncharacterised protein [Campylobacter geochelonis]CZE49863.1 Uncharacterised protein [Campylobacter geochelonis]
MKFQDQNKIVDYINQNLQGYDGLVQFSHRKTDANKDIFYKKKVEVENENGFICEAYFCNDEKSVSIKMLDGEWFINEIDIANISKDDIVIYETNYNLNVKMVQIWKEEKDEKCLGFGVLKLKNIVFGGFVDKDKGEDDDNSTL